MQNTPTVSSNINPTNFPPVWATLEKDLLCPLCEYNLRGLTESRCPECGFQFTWRELIDADRNKHPCSFEYGKGRNVKTFWTNYWRTCRPGRFWREVTPAQEVKLARVILYYFLVNAIFLIGLTAACTPYLKSIANVTYTTFKIRSDFNAIPGRPGFYRVAGSRGSRVISLQQLNFFVPLPWQPGFWDNVFYGRGNYSWVSRHMVLLVGGWAAILIAWPFLTLLSLIVFRFSMRQAKIKTIHLFRAVIYSCDFGLLLICIALVFQIIEFPYHEGGYFAAMAAACALIASYRLTIAFRKYLRVHLPLATVIASQTIAFLITFVVLIQLVDFTRQI